VSTFEKIRSRIGQFSEKSKKCLKSDPVSILKKYGRSVSDRFFLKKSIFPKNSKIFRYRKNKKYEKKWFKIRSRINIIFFSKKSDPVSDSFLKIKKNA
jgi:hypothetical protein